ncbi:hypothetical protein J6590_000359 [Homalodisca vitripennis]|nr:hypothetical protein J6590_000359 [Homalodisca vitripennis]
MRVNKEKGIERMVGTGKQWKERHVVEIGKNELPSCVREDTNSKLWTEARAQTNITRTSQIGRLTRKSMSVMVRKRRQHWRLVKGSHLLRFTGLFGQLYWGTGAQWSLPHAYRVIGAQWQDMTGPAKADTALMMFYVLG